MNWYRKAQLESTLPYFQEFEDMGDYVPKQDKLNKLLEEKYNTYIVKDIGQGDSGVAYLLGNRDILKITTNQQEAKVAQWLVNNPNSSIIDYKDIWYDGDLAFIIMEQLTPLNKSGEALLKNYIDKLITYLEKKDCYNIICAIEIIEKLPSIPVVVAIKEYLNHLYHSPFVNDIYDFLNPNNIGIKNGKLVFFDIT